MFQPRVYRDQMNVKGLNRYHINVDESDLLIFANRLDVENTKKYLIRCREEINKAIQIDQSFYESYKPIESNPKYSKIAKDMISASKHFNVGPMAAVAGAISLYLGRNIKKYNDDVIIENGGDLYINVKSKRYINIFTKDIVYKDKLNIVIRDKSEVSICTSSSKLGHSKSFGNSDAVVIKAKNAVFADAAATAFGNKVKNKDDIEAVLFEAKKNRYIQGIVIIIDGVMGVWGDIEFRERN